MINCSLLATAPSDFCDRRADEWRYPQLFPITSDDEWWRQSTSTKGPKDNRRCPPLVTSRGIQLHLPLFKISEKNVLALLAPIRGPGVPPEMWLCLPLLQTSDSQGIYSRHLTPLVFQSRIDMPGVAIQQIYGARILSLAVVEPLNWLDRLFAGAISDLLQSVVISRLTSADVLERLRSMSWCTTCASYARKWPSLRDGGVWCAKCENERLRAEISSLEARKLVAQDGLTHAEATCLFICMHARDKSDEDNMVLGTEIRPFAVCLWQ